MSENIEREQELTREDRLELEEAAIQALIDMGVNFSVPLKIYPVNPPIWIRWWNKLFPRHPKIYRDKRLPIDWDVSVKEMPDVTLEKVVEVYVRNFHIKPLFLGTIDRLRQLYIQIEYDEDSIQEEPLQESKKLFKYIPIMAEIAAVAVINNPSVADSKSREVKALKQFFIENLTVARLKKLSGLINQMMNPGGFTSSIRLIREMGTTKPRADLVE